MIFMLTDVEEVAWTFRLWGKTRFRRSVVVTVTDYQPYFYIPAPTSWPRTSDNMSPGARWGKDDTTRFSQVLNSRLPPDCQVDRVALVLRIPIMFYRPQDQGGSTYMQMFMRPGGNPRKAAGLIEKWVSDSATLSSQGYQWSGGFEAAEADVKVVTRWALRGSLSIRGRANPRDLIGPRQVHGGGGPLRRTSAS